MVLDTNNQKSKRKFWQFPWGYRESFLIAFAFLIAGFAVEWISGNKGIFLPGWPTNLFIIIILIAYFIIAHKFVKGPMVKWLSSPVAAISAISILTILILMMGFIKQGDEEAPEFIRLIGLNQVTNSWAYLFCSIYLVIILGFTIVRRSLPLSVKNFAFFLNHAGLWIVIVAASLGSADLWKLRMTLVEGNTVFSAHDDNRNRYELPFAIKLFDFKIEEYPPGIGLIDQKERVLIKGKDTQLIDAQEGAVGKLGEWEVSLIKYLPQAMPDTLGKYDTSSVVGSVPVVYVEAINAVNGNKIEGWVTSGSFRMPSHFLSLGDGKMIAMTIPAVKEYSSDIRFFRTGKVDDYQDYTLKVNQPVTLEGWTLYQTGYNESMGKWSNVSIIELIRDPWLPVVYVGIFMILLGSLYLVWMGRSKNLKKEEKDDLV